ncbi:hypothetical protein TNCV_1658502 [Trichonephila clavipes]|nr:hypothetical protein TNCV_1658502 [Trichonephila clavipes]
MHFMDQNGNRPREGTLKKYAFQFNFSVDATTDGPHNCELRSSDELAPPHQSTSSRTRVDLEQGRFNVHYPPLYGWSLVASGHEPVTLWS